MKYDLIGYVMALFRLVLVKLYHNIIALTPHALVNLLSVLLENFMLIFLVLTVLVRKEDRTVSEHHNPVNES